MLTCLGGCRAISQRRAAGLLPRVVCASAAAGYLAAAAWFVSVTRARMNPDAVAYFQIARHWAAGRFDLAVNAWFSPALSWLLVPAAWFGWDLLLTARVMNALLGLGFAAGAARLAGELGAKRMAAAVFAIALLRIVTAVGDEVTPDLLLACLLTWYLASSLRLLGGASPGRALAVGLLGGACFLVKAYALPFVVAHLCLTAILRWRLGLARPLRLPTAALAGVLLAAGPWVAIISIHSGRLTINSGGVSAEAWGPLPASGPLPVHMLQRPRPGRITPWENPEEIAGRWPKWAALPGESPAAVRIRAAAANARDLLATLVRADGLGLLLAGTIAAGLLAAARWGEGGDQAAAKVSALASFAIYDAGLLGLWVYDRFCWPMWGLMLAMFFSALDACLLPPARPARQAGAARGPGPAAGPQPAPARRLGRHSMRAAAVLVAAILAGCVARRVSASLHGRWGALPSARRGAQARRAARMLLASGRPARAIAANCWRRGLFSAYWARRPYLGRFAAPGPRQIAAELAPFGPTTVLIYDDARLAAAMGRLAAFDLVGVSVDRDGRHAVGWLEFRPRNKDATTHGN